MAHSGTIIYMRNVPGEPDSLALTAPLYCKNFDGTDGYIPFDFKWNGNSTPFGFQWLVPRKEHPIASCRHDWRCGNAKTPEERAWADSEYKKDISTTANPAVSNLAYVGVRIGAVFGVGSNY